MDRQPSPDWRDYGDQWLILERDLELAFVDKWVQPWWYLHDRSDQGETSTIAEAQLAAEDALEAVCVFMHHPGWLEQHLVPPEQWEACGAPTEMLALAMTGTEEGVPTGIAKTPGGRYFVLCSAGQGPMVIADEDSPSGFCTGEEGQ